MPIGFYLISFSTAPFFASRMCLTTFVLAWMTRLQQEGMLFEIAGLGLAANLDMQCSLPWLLSMPGLLVLGFLASMESLINKQPEMSEALRMVDDKLKGLANFVVNSYFQAGVGVTAAAAFAPQVQTAEFGIQTLWLLFTSVFVWFLAMQRNAVFNALAEMDEADDLGLRRFVSWAEDGWVTFGVASLVILPLLAMILAGLTLLALFAARTYVMARERAAQAPCPQCGHSNHLGAIRCANCDTRLPQPMHLGAFGQATKQPAVDMTHHRLELFAHRRCHQCATRLSRKRLRQRCPACGAEHFPSREEVDAFLAHVHAKLPVTLLISFLFSLIPLLGLIPGIIYYRLSLLSSLRRYMPTTVGCLTRWGVRIWNLILIGFQWVPGVGALMLPLLCLSNYLVYRAVLVRQRDAEFPGKSPPVSL